MEARIHDAIEMLRTRRISIAEQSEVALLLSDLLDLVSEDKYKTKISQINLYCSELIPLLTYCRDLSDQ